MTDPERAGLDVRQLLADQPSLSSGVFDQQDSSESSAHRSPLVGSLTTVSQKSSIDRTTRINCSKSTGLLI